MTNVRHDAARGAAPLRLLAGQRVGGHDVAEDGTNGEPQSDNDRDKLNATRMKLLERRNGGVVESSRGQSRSNR